MTPPESRERVKETVLSPDDLAFPGITLWECVVDVWDGMLGEVQPAEGRTRGKAIAAYANETGLHFTEIRCTKGYARLLTRQDVWESRGADRWYDDQDDFDAQPPADVPADWHPRDDDPCWTRCKPSDRGATACWFCEPRPPQTQRTNHE